MWLVTRPTPAALSPTLPPPIASHSLSRDTPWLGLPSHLFEPLSVDSPRTPRGPQLEAFSRSGVFFLPGKGG
jgi:hypothetical protein